VTSPAEVRQPFGETCIFNLQDSGIIQASSQQKVGGKESESFNKTRQYKTNKKFWEELIAYFP
jgi:hypothetical protein